MEIKSINTKKLYYASNKLSTIESRIYAEVETAHKFMCEGLITETEFAAIRADREKKMAPYKDGADLLTRFANAVNAQVYMAETGNIMAEMMVANSEPVESFDLEAVKAALRRAADLDDPMPC